VRPRATKKDKQFDKQDREREREREREETGSKEEERDIGFDGYG
jgi:hypothetical protein